LLGEIDIHLLAEGTHWYAYKKLGAHLASIDDVSGVGFAVWAPNARRVSVVGPFNQWDGRRHPMRRHPSCGVWEIFIPGILSGELYKYEIKSDAGELLALKADPFAFCAERPPGTASIVYELRNDRLQDSAWLERRSAIAARDAAIAIYEVHLGSWRRRLADAALSHLLAAVRIRAKTAENLTDGRRTGGAAVGCGLSDRKFDCLPPTIGL
jgi:1,4-alpha-glucan branching enzyme